MKNSMDLGFEEVFMTAVDFSTKFDYHVRYVHTMLVSVSRTKYTIVFVISNAKYLYRFIEK